MADKLEEMLNTVIILTLFNFLLLASANETAKVQFPPNKLKQQDCPDIDFSSQMGPTRYQGGGFIGTNMCHAFTAADLITVHQKLGAQNRISALDVANVMTLIEPSDLQKSLPRPGDESEARTRIEDHKKIERLYSEQIQYSSYMWGGIPNFDIEAYNLKKFACTERDLPSEIVLASRGRSTYAQDKITAAEDSAEQNLKNWNQWNPCLTKSNFQNLQDFDREYHGLIRHQAYDQLREACKLRLRPMVSHHLATEPGQAAEITIQQFKKGIPVGIGYDDMALSIKTTSRDSAHASTVAGSRWNKKSQTCEFKIRNSKGPKCNEKSPWKCTEGNYWIPEWQYSQMVTDLFYIESQR